MPKPLRQALIWSHEHQHYILTRDGQPEQGGLPADQSAFAHWLDEQTAFAFLGQAGRLSVLKEARRGGNGYWYAYRTQQRHTRKCYLGRSSQVTFVRLEEVARRLASSSAPAALAQAPTALLSSKFSPPPLPTSLVERERLLICLDGALATKLLLLSASAGWGKTTLLSAWAHQHQGQVAWLSLEALDNSPTRFWVALIAALRHGGRFEPGFGERVVALLSSPQPPPLPALLMALLQELESREVHPPPLVLVVDDYQVIDEPAVHESMSFFLEHLPVHLHLILSSRVDPDLPLSRLRVRGQLTEIRTDELRFRLEEASLYLGQLLSPVLSSEEAQRLLNRTEGWIAGLQLATLTLQKRADRTAFLQALTGSQRYLLDYVQEEILARLPESVRDFLLHAAILSRLHASVCQAVTAAPTLASSQQMLHWLERANLFVVSLDEEQRSYRLHELFREALLSALHTSQPELVPVLHRRAASFYEAQGEWHEAIAHRIYARDFSAAAHLMEQTAERFWLHGEAATVARWVMKLPELLVREHAPLLLTTALYLLNTVAQTTREQRARVNQQVRQLMARVDTSLRREIDEIGPSREATRASALEALPSKSLEVHSAEQALLRRHLRLLRAGMAWHEAALAGERERLSALHQEIQELDQDEEVIWQMLPLFCRFVLHYMFRQQGAKLLPRLLEAKEQVSWSGSPFVFIKVRQYLALAAVEAGKLRLASEESLAAFDLIEQIAGYALLKGYFGAVLAQVLYQWNRLEEARGRLQIVIQDAATWQHLDLLLSGYIALMQVELARGDLPAVERALHEVEHLEGYAYHRRWLPVIRARWWLAQGQLKAASDWAAGIVFPEESWKGSMYNAFPVVIRVYFAQRSFLEALSLLERWRSHLDRPTNIRITITYLAQSLVALHQTGKSKQAHEIAVRLLALTEPEGYLRVYLDEGEPMREVLLALLTTHFGQHELAASSRAYIARLLAAFEQEEKGAHTFLEAASTRAPGLSPAPQPLAVSPALDTTLTRREQEVLRLLFAGASNQEIAQALVISLDTVKKHVSNLLGKLGATSRTQAVAQARARSLL